MNTILIVRHFLKYLPYVIGILIFALYTNFVYNLGKKKFDRTIEINSLNQQIDKKNNEIKSLNDMLAKEKLNIKTITEYKTKIVTIEKEKPIYETQIQKIFEYNDNIIVPDELARLHDEIVCESTSNYNKTACRTTYTTKTPVTLKQFSTAMMNNYQSCKANSEQLIALQEWVIINTNKKRK